MEIITDNASLSANDMVLAKAMTETLQQHYPGHLWGVHVDGFQGMADIRNLGLSGNWGYRMKLGTMYSASSWSARVIQAGGEILERYRISRGRVNHDQLALLPTNFAGHVLGDMSKG